MDFYDEPGQLEHLDIILTIPELKGVQWIFGAGNPDFANWPKVYRKIREAGKLIQLFGDLDKLEAVTEQLGSTKGIYIHGFADISEKDRVMAYIRSHGSR